VRPRPCSPQRCTYHTAPMLASEVYISYCTHARLRGVYIILRPCSPQRCIYHTAPMLASEVYISYCAHARLNCAHARLRVVYIILRPCSPQSCIYHTVPMLASEVYISYCAHARLRGVYIILALDTQQHPVGADTGRSARTQRTIGRACRTRRF
jgi:hypothetical protein